MERAARRRCCRCPLARPRQAGGPAGRAHHADDGKADFALSEIALGSLQQAQPIGITCNPLAIHTRNPSAEDGRNTMRNGAGLNFALGVAVAAAVAVAAGRGHAQGAADPNSAPQSYRLDDGWAKLPPGRKWGAAVGVDIDRDGETVWVFDRCATADDCSASTLARSSISTPPAISSRASAPACSTIRTGFMSMPRTTCG